MDSTRHYGCLSMGSNPIESTKFNIIMTYEEFVVNVFKSVEQCPSEWRTGQAVFNVVDDEYGVARSVQFVDRVDCFYNDDYIEEFLKKAYERYMKLCES